MAISITRDFSQKHPRYIITNNDSGLSVSLDKYISVDNPASDFDVNSLVPYYLSLLDDAQLYLDMEKMLADYCTKTDPLDFYRCLFPVGSFERSGHFEDEKPNGLAMVVDLNNKARTIIVNDDLETIKHLQKTRFAFMSPIGYFGRTRKAENARQIYALTFDLDGVTLDTLENLLVYWKENRILPPKATWIIHSGYGLHLYYQLDKPIPAYPNLQRALKELKYKLLPLIWNKYTSKDENPQKQGIMQGFRVVGSGSKLGVEYPVTAYRSGDVVSLDYLLSYIDNPKEHERVVKLFQPLQKGELSLEEARKLYPDWYKRKIEGKGERQTWHIKRDLYDWWLRVLKEHGNVIAGRRYFCVMCLAIYARKCDVSEEELIEDALSLIPYFNTLNRNELDIFTEDDVMTALSSYADRYATFPRKDMEAISGIAIPPNKRNGRKRIDHITRLNKVFDLEKELGESEKRGRRRGSFKSKTPKGDLIRKYSVVHPTASHSEIARALGVSRTTVIKWLK